MEHRIGKGPFAIPLAFVPTWLCKFGRRAAPMLAIFIALQGYGGGAIWVRPSVTSLADDTGMSRGSVYRCLRELVRLGVVLERTYKGRRREWHCLPAREEDVA